MGIRMDIKSTDFYNELSEEKQKQFFSLSEKKYLPSIDNIYYGLILENDCKGNLCLKPFFERLDELKEACSESHKPQPIGIDGLLVDLLSFNMYKYCISSPDLYDIFISSVFPNDSTPRIVVQLRAHGLWQHGTDKMLADSYNSVLEILEPYGVTVKSCRENRIDYCYHTNAIQKPEKTFSDRNLTSNLDTTMEKWRQEGRIKKKDGKTVLLKDYLTFGNRSSNNVYVRIYNKVFEVIEMGYKGFFFEIWEQKGLINAYDKYCFEKALSEENYDYVHKAKLEFYMEHGSDENVKKEFQLALSDKNSTLKDFENLAKQYMPEVTTVLNIEYETKRKFYYYSDDFIDGILKEASERDDVPEPLKRLYKIMDNRKVFLDYLTSKTVSFKRKDGRYAAWWERLRNTKLGGLNIDVKLVREYSSKLDEKLVRKRFVNTVVTNAVYAGNIGTSFIEDISDLLSNLNDNDAQRLRVSIYKTGDRKKLRELYGEALSYYAQNKQGKYQKLKNRISETKTTPLKAKK